MQLIGLFIVFGAIILFEVPRLLKDKMWGELMAFAGFMALGSGLALAYLFKIELPSPTTLVEWAFSPISEVILSLLK